MLSTCCLEQLSQIAFFFEKKKKKLRAKSICPSQNGRGLLPQERVPGIGWQQQSQKFAVTITNKNEMFKGKSLETMKGTTSAYEVLLGFFDAVVTARWAKKIVTVQLQCTHVTLAVVVVGHRRILFSSRIQMVTKKLCVLDGR